MSNLHLHLPSSQITPHPIKTHPQFPPIYSPFLFSSPPFARGSRLGCRKNRRRSLLVTRAGPPTTTNLIFAFVFPLTLLAATIFTSIRIADKLDQDFLEELAANEAMKEEEEEQEQEEEEEEEEELPASVNQEPAPALPRARNRPKREA